MILANARTDIHEAVMAAHATAYQAVSLFGEHHKLKNGKLYDEPEPKVSFGTPVIHGVFSNTLDFISLSTLVVGARLRTNCKCAMKEMGVQDIRSALNKTSMSGRDWRIGDVRVTVKNFMKPIFEFLQKHADQVEAYVCTYHNEVLYTDVFGLVIMSKHDSPADRLTWEITIDDADLVPPLSVRGLFGRK